MLVNNRIRKFAFKSFSPGNNTFFFFFVVRQLNAYHAETKPSSSPPPLFELRTPPPPLRPIIRRWADETFYATHTLAV